MDDKNQSILFLAEMFSWLANSVPLSDVMLKNGSKELAITEFIAASIVAASLFGSLTIIVYIVAISTIVSKMISGLTQK